jgi:hypothetical protein
MVAKALSNRLIGVALGMAALACQASDLTLPSDGRPSNLKAVSGGGQQGTVGTELPKPLVVRVTDAAARPVREASLRFLTDVPAAQVLPAEITTNDSGFAEVRVVLGQTEGTQTFDAQLTNASDLRTTFAVEAVADHAADDGGGGGDGGGQGGGGGNSGGDGHGHDGHGNGHGHGHGHGHDGDEGDD